MSTIDPKELEALIKRMRDAGRSEERIAEVTKLYKEQYAKKAKGSTVTAASVEPVQDAANLENGGLASEDSSLDFQEYNPKINIPYPTQAKDAIASSTSSKDYIKNFEDNIAFLKSDEGKAYTQRKRNYRASVRSKLNNNGAYRLGLEGQSISELEEKGLFGELASASNELHFGMYGDSMPDNRSRDLIIQEEIEKAKAEENKKLLDLELDEAAKYQKAGNYDVTIEKGYNNIKSELTSDQIEYKNLMDQASDIRAKIVKEEDIPTIKKYNTELLDLEEKIKKVEPLALEDKSPLLDALTGQPLGTFEAAELPTEQVIDTRSEIQKLKDSYTSITQESLERNFFTHTLDTQRLNKELESTIDIFTGKEYLSMQEGSVLGETLKDLGYEIEASDWRDEYGNVGLFKNVKIKDLLAFRKNDAVMSSIQKYFDKQRGGDPVVYEKIKDKLDDLAKEKIKLALQKEALKETYILNVSPSSETPGFTSKLGSFGKEAAKSMARIVGVDKEIAEMIPSTRMEELDEINKLFNSDAIAISEENKAAFNRDFTMNLAEGLGAFTGDLVQFAFLNKAAGVAGITARIAQISSKNKVLGTTLKLLQEEFNFQVVTKGEAPTGEGIFFGLGSMGAARLVPKIKNSSFSAVNNLITKTVSGGLGMAGGSEAAKISHAFVDDLLGKKDIETSLEEQYGSLDETGKRIVLNIAMGAALGVKSINKRDFYSIARRKKLLKETITDLNSNKFKGSEIAKKQQLVAELNADIALAEEKFNKLSIKEQAESKEVAEKIIKTGQIPKQLSPDAPFRLEKANAFELKEAQRIVDSYEINRLLAEKNIRKSFENLMRSGVIKDAKLVITDDASILEAGNKGQFEKDTNTIKININEYKPGVFEQEAGHLFMKTAFENNPKVAEAFKAKIQKEVTEALKNEKFNVGDKENVSFEEAINEAYKDKPNTTAEEYVMNLVEFLSTPKYKDLLLKKGLLNNLKQETLNTANKIGFDYTNKKNFKTGADLLEFLFSIGKTIEGGSSKAIKNKFEAFKNLVIDGNKLLDLKTGKKAAEPKEAEKTMASVKIEESEKKDIFSKANKAYEDYKNDPSAAGLMVGLEFEPIVKKMLNKYRDLYGMDEYTLDLIANDVMIETRPGYNGIPALVRTWDPAKGASLTSHIYGNLPKRILGIIQNKYPDLGKTVELVQEKADKLTTDEGFGGSGMANDGFVDISSPEAYTRVSRKKAEVIMGMPPEYIKRSEEVGERILMSTKLQDLDAKIVGTIKDSEGRTLRVAMLESNKARVYLPDGTTEIIKARTPKVVEQKYGAADRSFKKIATTKSQMVEEAKAYLIPEMEKTAGGLKDNYEPTPQYTEFIDKTFSLYKDYLSQSAINKRFADFKEPVIDPKTGKQAREKTAQGNKIFTKKPLTLAEWRKYFIGDGTKRIDGRRRSLLEALATEQGFDKVLEVLSKEDMRKQIESRQKDLSTELVKNYVAIIAKSLDRNNPNVMASADIKEVADAIGKDVKYVENEMLAALGKKRGDYFAVGDELEQKRYKDHNNLFEEFYVVINERHNRNIDETIKEEANLKPGIKTYLQEVLNVTYNVDKFTEMKNFEEPRYNEYKSNVNEVTNYLLPQMRFMNYGKTTAVENPGTFLGRFFGFDGKRNKKILSNDPLGKTKDKDTGEIIDRGLNLSRKEFVKFADKKGEEIGSKYNEFKSSLPKEERAKLENLEEELNLDDFPSISKHYADFRIKHEKAVTKKGATEESVKKVIKEFIEKNDNYIKEQDLRTRFFYNFLDVIDYVGKKKLKVSEAEYDKYMENFISPFFISQVHEGFRYFSRKEWYSTVPAVKSKKTRDQHIKAKVVVAAEFINLFAKRKLNPESPLNKKEVERIFIKYESSFAAAEHQERADNVLKNESAKSWSAKIGTEQDLLGGQKYDLNHLKTTISVITEETLYKRYMRENFTPIVEGLKQEAEAKAHNDKIIEDSNPEVLASKEINLAEETANMIERRTGISAKAPLSAARAANMGRTKGKFDFYLPPNAEDFAGLLYKLYGKGKQGDKDMAFMKEHLLDPYNAGEQAISTYKQNLAEDYKSIEKQLGEIEGTVSKETKATLDELGFNADQAVRVALWNQAGFEVPGIQNIEAAKLRIAVVKDKRLKAYADGIRTIVKGNLFEPSEQWFSSNIRYDLFTHATEGVRPKFLEQWDTNVKEIFNKENLIKLEAAYGKDYVKNLNDMIARMKTGKSRGANLGKEANAALDYLNGSIGVTMWMNTRSAMLQTISAVNYINWSDNNPIRIAQTLAKPKEFASTFMEIFNSDFLKQRRSGLEINIEEAEIARAVEKSKSKASRIFNALIKAGFTPTQIADSFAIAIGGTPFLMNRTKTYQRKGFEYAEAREKAFNDLREISEENQQSSRQDKVSNIQVGVMGRLIFAFNNTPFQMTRLQKKAALDLVNRRGDWKTNTSKLAYYSVLQSVVFYALQQGAALTLFGKDDEDLTKEEKENISKYKEKKVIGLANSVLDGFLSGSGLPGKILVGGKNTLAKYLEEEKKGYKADYGNVLNEAFSISPVISSKTKKAYSAFKTFRYGSTKKGKAKYDQSNKLSPLHPINVARAKMFSAISNIPLDRVISKIDNLNEAVTNTDIEPQIKLALALGWGKWSLGFYDDLYGEDADSVEKSEKKSNKKIKKKSISGKKKKLRKGSRQYKDSIRVENFRKKYLK